MDERDSPGGRHRSDPRKKNYRWSFRYRLRRTLHFHHEKLREIAHIGIPSPVGLREDPGDSFLAGRDSLVPNQTSLPNNEEMDALGHERPVESLLCETALQMPVDSESARLTGSTATQGRRISRRTVSRTGAPERQ